MKRALDRDVKTPSPYPGVFAFEVDFGGTLRCIPMSVRMKLDRAGIKLSLKQWNKLPAEERRGLTERPCDDAGQTELYRQYLVSLIERFTTAPAEPTPTDEHPAWADATTVPNRINAWARGAGVPPPTAAQWSGLSPLQRFALFKLTRPGHTNENFIPAMREFSIIP